MVKYTTLVPYIGLSESDLLYLYTNLEFCEGKNHKHFINTLIYKAKKFMLTHFFQESLQILEDGASGVQEGSAIIWMVSGERWAVSSN